MKTSAHGVEFIEAQEGWSATAYHLPGEAHWTIGYGHYGADVHQGMVITRARGTELLRGDLATAERSIGTIMVVTRAWKLSQGKFDALVSLVFNCGSGVLAPGSSLGRALRTGRMTGVPEAMMLYVHDSTGAVSPGLVARRRGEVAMWKAGRAAGPASWLTKTELKRCQELDALRRVASPTVAQRTRIVRLVDLLAEQRQRVWRSAQPSPKGDGKGWDHANRRARWESLRARTT